MNKFFIGIVLWLTTGNLLAAVFAVNDSRTSPQSFPNTINVLSNDTVDEPVNLTISSAPNNGTVSVISDGVNPPSVRYTPDANFTGVDTFTYTITGQNSSDTADATVTLSIVTIESLANRQNARSMASVIDIMCPKLISEADSELSAGQILLKDQCNDLFLLAALDSEAVAGALNAIANEEIPAQAETIRSFTKAQTNSIESRLHDVRSGAVGVSFQGLTLNVDGETLEGYQIQQLMNEWRGGSAGEIPLYFPEQRLSLFMNGDISDGSKDGSDLETGYDIDGLSITLGADYRLTNNLVAGIAVGFNATDVDYVAGLGTTETESTNYILYTTYYQERFSVDAMIGMGYSDINTDRRIFYSGGGSTTDTMAQGETTGDQRFLSVTAYYEFAYGSLGITPYAAFDYLNSQIDGYSENNAAGWEQSIEDRDVESMVLSLGTRVSYAWSIPWGVFLPHFGLSYEKETKEEREPAKSSFLFDPDSLSFDIGIDDADTSYFEASVGASVVLPHGVSLFFDYQQLLGYEDYDASQMTFGGRWEVAF